MTWKLFITRAAISTLLILTGWWIFSVPANFTQQQFATTVFDRHGHLLGARIAADGQWRFPSGTVIPYRFKKALLRFEDRYFYYHPGVNPVALFKALRHNLIADGKRIGGSTITMQAIRLARKNPSRTLAEKCTEILRALRLELTYSKNQILSYYAASAPFGGNVVGLEAASWRYFSKSPGTLSWGESALLAVLPNAPGLLYPGRNPGPLLKKRNDLLDRLHASGEIDSLTCVLAKAEPIPEGPEPLPDLTPHLTERIVLEGGAFRANHTTIDCHLQRRAMETLEQHLIHQRANHVNNGAILISDVTTGEVLAYVGNAPHASDDHGRDVDVITAPRSSGSILKPLLYTALLESGELLPDALIPDLPVSFRGYSPKNFTGTYEGAVHASSAIARSLNVPSVQMLRQYGVVRFHHYLTRAGITTLDYSPEHYGLSLILGGAETSLWDLAGVYTRMARALLPGRKTKDEPVWFMHEPGRKTHQKLPDPGAAWFAIKAMAAVSRPEQELNWQYFSSEKKISWKTGTSYGFRDAWAVGVTPEYQVGVWIGNASGEGRPGLTGLSAAGPVLLDLFRSMPATTWFNPPYRHLKETGICPESGLMASQACPNPENRMVPGAPLSERGLLCNYHRIIQVDHEGLQVNAGCADFNEFRPVSWFVLPPTMAWYYSQQHPHYKPLPPWRKGCLGGSGLIEIIYPSNNAEIFVPKNLDGTSSESIFEAAHRTRGSTLYWHLDHEYHGATAGHHRMAFRPEPGDHILTLVDESGYSTSVRFKVLAGSQTALPRLQSAQE